MRIIAGKYRGRTLSSFEGDKVRPTADRVKESVFEMLSSRIPEARVLDLFCGSGALGIECLSRGAREVVFNDISRDSLALLKKNLARVQEPFQIFNRDFSSCLKTIEGKFDLILSDPPYRENYLPEILQITAERDLLSHNGLLVHEGERDERIPQTWRLVKVRKYGRTIVHFLERNL